MPAVRAMTLIPAGTSSCADRLAQLLAVLTLDAARDAAAARVVGHQHQVAAGERDVGRERRALVAALVLVDLDDQLLAFPQLLGDAAALSVAVTKVLRGRFP